MMVGVKIRVGLFLSFNLAELKFDIHTVNLVTTCGEKINGFISAIEKYLDNFENVESF